MSTFHVGMCLPIMLFSTDNELTLSYIERQQKSSHVIILESSVALLRRALSQTYFV